MLLRRYHEVKEEVKEINLKPINSFVEKELNLEEITVKELKEMALEMEIEVPKKIKKEDLIKLIREG